MYRVPVAVLGATGLVGQKCVRLLLSHPFCCVGELVSSQSGALYGDVVFWRESCVLPRDIYERPVCSLEEVTSQVAISALPSSVASDWERRLTATGIHVFTNASSFRMAEDVPLIIPEVNPEAMTLLDRQRCSGKLVANSNCAVATIAPALAPLLSLGTLEHLSVVTLQAVSGAGRSGLAACDIHDNVVPLIVGEEEKIQAELRRLLPLQEVSIAVNANRVPISHGHTAVLHLLYREPVSAEDAWCRLQESARHHSNSYRFYRQAAFPQPVLLGEEDMAVHIGRLETSGRLLTLVALSHNLVRGAAGAALANVVLALERQVLPELELGVAK